jgi:hypothetical protein
MDVVFNLQEAGGLVVARVDSSIPYILGVLDQSWTVIQVSGSI